MADSMPTDPFDDIYGVILAQPLELEDDYIVVDHPNKQTVERPVIIPVPILIDIPPTDIRSPEPSASTPEVLPPSPHPPINWSNGDLSYLLSILYPDPTIADQLILSPSREALQDTPAPIHLQLYLHTPNQPVPREAYSANLPIGTGRPISEILIASSSPLCSSPTEARKSLAAALLSNFSTTRWIAYRYNLLFDLYSLDTPELLSIRRGMVAMGRISEVEWCDRVAQLRQAGVDESWGLEARLEGWLLEGGRSELDWWLGVVDVALGLDEMERGNWADDYGKVVDFLKTAVMELRGLD